MPVTQCDLSVELAPGEKRSLMLRNPVMTASGTFGNGLEFAKVFDIQRLGGVASKGLTLKPRRGNPTPRIAETPAGMLNSIGFQNLGLRKLVREVCPVWATWKTPVVVNILGESVGEFAELARELDGVPGVSALEVNVSCPNLDSGGMEFGVDPVMTAAVTDAVRQSTTLPVIVKLTPNVTDIVPLAQAAESAGAHALCVANSFLGTSIDVETRRTRTHRPMSGLTGPAIRPLAVRLVWQTAQAVSIPIIGCGGITSSRDALEFLLAGASIVQVGTATFSNPYAPLEVLEGIEAYCREHDVGSLSELVGAALPRG
jgi:dihydroorotate dehydrogenase (NAD+) catalytic subunit